MKVYDTLSREKVELEPVHPPHVRMYVCGPTVYDSPHVGHARSAVAFDIIRRYLEYKGYDVIFTRNYTDIDDKMIDRANQRGISITRLAKKYIAEYEIAMDALNVKPPVYAPRATHLIAYFIAFIQRLIDKDVAYFSNGSVYFSVPSFKPYGKLSQKPKKEIENVLWRDSEDRAGDKRDPRDFALWKKQKPGEPAWTSPWGLGRPGWHIECSVMSMKFLGDSIDIHGGGWDLVFPHHENEIAQSEAYTGKTFVKYWLHNGFVTVAKEKMSKSLGNFFTVAEILEEYEAPALRLFLTSGHYRNPIDFSRDLLDQAEKNWTKIMETRDKLVQAIGTHVEAIEAKTLETNALPRSISPILKEFENAMDDDFNAPRAMAALFSLLKEINERLAGGTKRSEILSLEGMYQVLEVMLGIFGFDRAYIERHASLTGRRTTVLDALIKKLVEERNRERIAKNYQRSDEIRDFLASLGVELSDGKDGTTWKILS